MFKRMEIHRWSLLWGGEAEMHAVPPPPPHPISFSPRNKSTVQEQQLAERRILLHLNTFSTSQSGSD